MPKSILFLIHLVRRHRGRTRPSTHDNDILTRARRLQLEFAKAIPTSRSRW